ncbi:MAG: HSP20 family protein [Motiliproteus sp.]|jgi:HSP20 family protein
MNIERLSPSNWFKKEDEHHRRGALSTLTDVERTFPLSRLHQDIDRMFDEVLQGFGSSSLFQQSPLLDRQMAFRPNLDVHETDDKYSVCIEVPGIEEKDIKIRLQGDSLLISGEKTKAAEEQTGTYHRVERCYGKFQRVLSLPQDADKDKITADFSKGLLTVAIGKNPAKKETVKDIKVTHDLH